MKTFATLCLLGIASAIKLKEEDGERGPGPRKEGDDYEGPEGPTREQCEWLLASDMTLESVNAYAAEQLGEDFEGLDQEDVDGAIAFCSEQAAEAAAGELAQMSGPTSSSEDSSDDGSCVPDVESCPSSSSEGPSSSTEGPSSSTEGPSSSTEGASTTEDDDEDGDEEVNDLAQMSGDGPDGPSGDDSGPDGPSGSGSDGDDTPSESGPDGDDLAQIKEDGASTGKGPDGPGSDGSDDEDDGPDAEDCEFAAGLFADGLPSEETVAEFLADEWDPTEPFPTAKDIEDFAAFCGF